MIVTPLEPQNAWVHAFTDLTKYIDVFFRDSKGQVWGYKTHLEVLGTTEHFEEFYVRTLYNRLSASGKERVTSVKLVLDAESYRKLVVGDVPDLLRQNLRQYPDEAPPVLVTSEVNEKLPKPPFAFPGQLAFCVDQGLIRGGRTLVVHLLGGLAHERMAIAWPLEASASGDRVGAVREEAVEGLNRIFNAAAAFRALKHGSRVCSTGTLLDETTADTTRYASEFVLHDLGEERTKLLAMVALELECQDAANVFGLPQVHIGTSLSYYAGDVATEPHSWPRKRYSILLCVMPDVGNVKAAAATAELLRDFQPDKAILLGIAAGIGVCPPTVVCARAVFPYEYGRVKDAFLRTRTDWDNSMALQCDHEMVRGAEVTAAAWAESEEELIGVPGLQQKDVKVTVGHIASGLKVSMSRRFRNEVGRRSGRKARALEMEAEGVGVACSYALRKVPFMVVKAISDMGDRSKKDGDNRRIASRAAAAFVLAMLKRGVL